MSKSAIQEYLEHACSVHPQFSVDGALTQKFCYGCNRVDRCLVQVRMKENSDLREHVRQVRNRKGMKT